MDTKPPNASLNFTMLLDNTSPHAWQTLNHSALWRR